jgi:predicted regulator of Ras-like GTPase activity (Roadblock/LC7/MglB family)
MEAILQSLLELPGVNATLVVDGHGHLVAQRSHAVYDVPLCEQVSAVLARVVDSIHLQHEDWESVAANFADGKLLLRNVGPVLDHGPCVLVVAGDATLNVSFAVVSIRVAANKLRRLGEAAYTGRTPAPASWPSSPASPPPPIPSSTSGLRPPPSVPGRVSPPPFASPTPEAAEFLLRCTKELARHVGPMARVFVEEALRRISPGQPFALASAAALLQDVAGQIEDPASRGAFLAALQLPSRR